MRNIDKRGQEFLKSKIINESFYYALNKNIAMGLGIEKGMFLTYLIEMDWVHCRIENKSKDKFFRYSNDIEKDTCLSKTKQYRIAEEFKKMGLLQTGIDKVEKNGYKNVKAKSFKVNHKSIAAKFGIKYRGDSVRNGILKGNGNGYFVIQKDIYKKLGAETSFYLMIMIDIAEINNEFAGMSVYLKPKEMENVWGYSKYKRMKNVSILEKQGYIKSERKIISGARRQDYKINQDLVLETNEKKMFKNI